MTNAIESLVPDKGMDEGVVADVAPSAENGTMAAMPSSEPILAVRLAMAPELVRPDVSSWDTTMRLPLQQLSLENAYGDPELLGDLGIRGAEITQRLDVDVIVGAETAGVPFAAVVSLVCGRPFAFVRKPGYCGHEAGEPPVDGAALAGRRVLFVGDAVWRGTAVEGFVRQLHGEQAQVVGLFCLVDMRDVADKVTPAAAALPTEAVSTYLDALATAARHGVLGYFTYELAVDAIVSHWPDSDPRWSLLEQAS